MAQFIPVVVCRSPAPFAPRRVDAHGKERDSGSALTAEEGRVLVAGRHSPRHRPKHRRRSGRARSWPLIGIFGTVIAISATGSVTTTAGAVHPWSIGEQYNNLAERHAGSDHWSPEPRLPGGKFPIPTRPGSPTPSNIATPQRSPAAGPSAVAPDQRPLSRGGGRTPLVAAAPTLTIRSTVTPPPAAAVASSPGTGVGGAGSALRNCLAHPSACGYPEGSNTGVPPGTTLRSSGPLTLAQAGQVVSGLDITGGVVITASNVVVKNSRIHNVENYAAIIVRGKVSGVVISHVEIDGGKQTPSVVGITGSGFTADAVNIHGTADGIDAGDTVVVENSWIHDLWVADGDHTDGVRTSGGAHLLIVHDTIDATGAATNSAVIMGADLGDLSNTQLRDCLLDGGTYTVYAGADPGNSSGIITIANNRYGDHAQYGPNSFRASPDGAIVFTGNVWDASGAPLRE